MVIESRIIPISGPSIRWDIFLKDTSDLIGHNITRKIDTSGLKLDGYAKFLAALGEFQDSEVTPIDTLKNNEVVLRHLHFSFLIIGPTELILKISESNLDLIITEVEGGHLALVSGNLVGWRCLIVELCSDSKGCKLGKNLLDFFFKFGLQYIFANYSRKPQMDGTLLLKYKAL